MMMESSFDDSDIVYYNNNNSTQHPNVHDDDDYDYQTDEYGQSYPSRRDSNASTSIPCKDDFPLLTVKDGDSISEEIWEEMKRRLNLLHIYLGLDDDEDYFVRHAGDANSDDGDDNDDDDDDNDTATTVSSILSMESHTVTDVDVSRRKNTERGDENNSLVVRIVDR
jgi:hypothetical protein